MALFVHLTTRAARSPGQPLPGASGGPFRWLTLLVLLLLARPGFAQAPAWELTIPNSLAQPNGTSRVQATALNAAGEVLVVGYFTETVIFGSIMLNSTANSTDNADLFVAKYLPATGTWAWAYRGGGTGRDQALGLAVSGNAVYVTGYIYNNLSDRYHVTLDDNRPGTVPATSVRGTNPNIGLNIPDLLLAKYVDQGSSAALAWVQVGGGTGDDLGQGVAVSGTSVYVTGSITNTLGDDNSVRFGSDGTASTTAGLLPIRGTSRFIMGPGGPGGILNVNRDLLLAKYVDQGSSAALAWVQVGGGMDDDLGQGVAVSGTSVYITGSITNTLADGRNVRFGSDGTASTTAGLLPIRGTSPGPSSRTSSDLLLAKYVDNGSTGSLQWAQVGGGINDDRGLDVAVRGTSVYITGSILNTLADDCAVRFGSDGTATTTAGLATVRGTGTTATNNLLLAKYVDTGSTGTLQWVQVGGGGLGGGGSAINSAAVGYSVAVSGTSVYVAGTIYNSLADGNGVRFGSDGTATTTAGLTTVPGASSTPSQDVLLAKYTDNGSTGTLQWAQVGGGPGDDRGQGVAVRGTSLYVGSFVNGRQVSFGTATNSPLQVTNGVCGALSELTDAGITGTWTRVSVPFTGGTSRVQATALNAAGEVLVAGSFTGSMLFGSTVLASAGGSDLFVAKYLPATGIWAWAYRGGGNGDDGAEKMDLAVSGSAVYLTGAVLNNLLDTQGVTLDDNRPSTVPATTVRGTSASSSTDLLLAKYVDQGSSAALAWVQVGGGTFYDQGLGVAVSGTSVYVTGYISNSIADDSSVRFGSDGTATTTTGLPTVRGTSASSSTDLLLAKYVDQGSSAALAWVQVGGGTSYDQGQDVAVRGTSVYVTGFIVNNITDDSSVRFGSDGTATTTTGLPAVRGTSASSVTSISGSFDLLLAKYVDQGNSAALAWVQVGGGMGDDRGQGIAVSGTDVYITGFISNTITDGNSVRFGSDGTATTTTGLPAVRSPGAANTADLLLAKYVDQGSSAALAWVQVGGGTGGDQGLGVVVSGTSVYVTGYISNTIADGNSVRFGSDGTATTTTGLPAVAGASGSLSQDVLLAKYVDQGSAAAWQWTKVGGGTGSDQGTSLAVRNQQVYVAGYVLPAAQFGSLGIAQPVGSNIMVLARLTDAGINPLPVTLVSFTAIASGPTAVALAWATASEVNSARFEVERSLDGVAWAQVGSVAAAGSSSTHRSYAYLDASAPTGQLYYRLRQVDFDGTTHYSPVRTVVLAGRGGSLALYPTPTSEGAATLTGAPPGTTVRVLDTMGRLVRLDTADTAGTVRLAGFLPGLYLVQAGSTSVRLVVEQ